jgi:hypothetical protein
MSNGRKGKLGKTGRRKIKKKKERGTPSRLFFLWLDYGLAILYSRGWLDSPAQLRNRLSLVLCLVGPARLFISFFSTRKRETTTTGKTKKQKMVNRETAL